MGAWLSNPYVLGGGLLLGLIMLMRGGGGSDSAAVTLRSQEIAASTNVALAEIQAGRDAALAQVRAQEVATAAEAAVSNRAIMAGLTASQAEISVMRQQVSNELQMAQMDNFLASDIYRQNFALQSQAITATAELEKYRIDEESALTKYISNLGYRATTQQLNQEYALGLASIEPMERLLTKQMELQNAQHILDSERYYQTMQFADNANWRATQVANNKNWYDYDIVAAQIDASKGGIFGDISKAIGIAGDLVGLGGQVSGLLGGGGIPSGGGSGVDWSNQVLGTF